MRLTPLTISPCSSTRLPSTFFRDPGEGRRKGRGGGEEEGKGKVESEKLGQQNMRRKGGQAQRKRGEKRGGGVGNSY